MLTFKNRPGGLKGRFIQPKVVVHYENSENPDRCFVKLFKQYISLCPPDCPKNAFYLQPLRNPNGKYWFSKKPIGHNRLEGTVARMCLQAGIVGFHTNHSLRATTATRLYQAGIDEQLVMEQTGHRSLDGVRNYKHSSDSQKKEISKILNCNSNAVAKAKSVAVSEAQGDGVPSLAVQLNQSLANNVSEAPSFNFHSCMVLYNSGKSPAATSSS